jgi:hypothetical protein
MGYMDDDGWGKEGVGGEEGGWGEKGMAKKV